MKMFLPFKSLLIAGGFSLLSFLYVGAVPVASSVQIAPFGPYVPGNVITANYIYTDTPGSDAEANSIIHWYTSPNSNGSGATTIATLSSANAPFTLIIPEAYRGLYIGFSVTPADGTGEVGSIVYSNWELVNNYPVAVNDSYTNACQEGGSATITAPGVLSNDTNGDNGSGQTLSITTHTSPLYGLLSISSSGAFTYTHNGSENHQDSFTYYITDGYEVSRTAARVDLTIVPVNDAPVLSNIEVSALAYSEDEAAKIITSSIQAMDPDLDDLVSATISIGSGFVPAEDRLSITPLSGLTQSYNSTTGVLTLSGKQPSSIYQGALRMVRYNNINTANPNTSNRVVSFIISDGTLSSIPVTRTIQTTAVNDPPVANPDTYNTNINEGGSLTTTTANGVLFNDIDVDDATITAHLVTNVVHGLLTFNANGTFTYRHDSSETVSDAFTYYAYDGKDRSDTVTVSLSITPVNDPPVLATMETDTLQYTEDDPSKIITSTTTLTDADDTYMESATVSIVSGFVQSEDSLVFPAVTGLTIAYDTIHGILTATGHATRTVYQNNLLRNIRYWNTNTKKPSTAYRRIRMQVNDGDAASNNVERVVRIIPKNDPPVATNAALSGVHFYVGERIRATYTYTDPDGDAQGSTEIRWYTAQDAQGTGVTQILGWLTDTFTIRNSEGGLYLRAIIRPRDPSGTYGTRDTTNFYYVNAAPVLNNFTFVNARTPGAYAVGETMTASFTYSDLENNPAGTHRYQWYRSNTNSWDQASTISGEVADTFKVRSQDNNRYIGLETRPVATIGSSPGAVHRSPLRLISTLPTANIANTVSGINDSICKNGSVNLKVTLGGENPPWSFAYTINGAHETVVSNIPAAQAAYVLAAHDTGTYEIVWVSDSRNPQVTSTVGGRARVAYYPSPTARLTQSALSICDNDTARYRIPIALTGKAPWQVSYRYSLSTDSATLQHIDTVLAAIVVGSSNTGTYRLLHVWDAHCMAVANTATTSVVAKVNPRGTLLGTTTTVCTGNPAALRFQLEGQGPWTIRYTLNGGEEIEQVVPVSTSSYTYEKQVTEPGTYALVKVQNAQDVGCAYGSFRIENYAIPTATLSGSKTVCEGKSTTFDVSLLTGTAPWNFSYQNGTNTPVTVNNVTTSTYSLTAQNEGNYQILTVNDAHGCHGEATGTAHLTVNPLPDVNLFINRTIFTSNEGLNNEGQIDGEPITISPSGGHFNTSSFPLAIYNQGNDQYEFVANIAYNFYCRSHGDPAFDIRYTYTDAATGCSNTAAQEVTVLAAAADISIVDSAYRELKLYCTNFDTIKLRGVNLSGEDFVGTFTLKNSTGQVIPGLENTGDNLANLYPWLLNSGNNVITYEVNLAGEGDEPAIATASKTLNFDAIHPNFSWDNECFDEQALVRFNDTSTASQSLVESKWRFFVDNDTIDASGFDTSFTYTARNTYAVEHVVFSELDGDRCTDTIRKDIVLKPTYEVRSMPYDEDFNDGANFWTTTSINTGGANSWQLGLPQGDKFTPQSGEEAWYTYITNNLQGESSYVISPCYDFSGSQRPMIKLDLWKTFTNADGAVLQYTVNHGETWQTLGAPEDGINWYNSYSTAGSPGGQGLGWARQDAPDAGWTEARHKLDELNGQNGVRFRIAYGAINNQTIERDGLAFDNVWIGERNKNVLIEYFTNTTNSTAATINQNFNTLVNKEAHSSDLVDLHYFLNPADPFYSGASSVYSARSLYYDGIARVPYGIIDGGRGDQPDYLIDFSGGESLNDNDLTRAELAESPFGMNIQTIKGVSDVEIDITLTALEAMTNRDLALQVVVVEEVVALTGASGQTHFESVVRTMLPDAIGTQLPGNWTAGTPMHYNFNYTYNGLYDDSQLRIVAYVQDESSREVLQAIKINPNVTTGLEEEKAHVLQQLSVYPNPARSAASVEWSQPVSERSSLELLTIDGSLVDHIQLESGQDSYLLPVSQYRPGLYLLRLHNEQVLTATEKLIVLE